MEEEKREEVSKRSSRSNSLGSDSSGSSSEGEVSHRLFPVIFSQKPNNELKSSKRKPFEVHLVFPSEFVTFLFSDNQQRWNELKNMEAGTVISTGAVDFGENYHDKAIRVFDENETSKWAVATKLIELYSLFQEEVQKPAEKAIEIVLLIPDGRQDVSQEWCLCSSGRRVARSTR
jgi:hypothetical protein